MGGFTVIGDAHGHMDKYIRLTREYEYTIQLGDLNMGNGAYDRLVPEVCPYNHKHFFGNHDHYPDLEQCEKLGYNLGHFGSRSLNGVQFFFIRGGFSIDWPQRTLGVDLWAEEELNDDQMGRCMAEYSQAKPDIVLSHECPESVGRILFPNRFILEHWGYSEEWASNTQKFLEELFLLHQPKLWCFGHYHSRRDRMIQGTRFVCVEELGAFNVES